MAEAAWLPIAAGCSIRRAIQKEIVQPLAVRILQGEFRDGDRILVDVQKGHLEFRHQEAPAQVAA